jgi:hypothetical protein
MPNLAPLFPLILVTHVALAVSLFVPSLLLHFTLRNRSVVAGAGVPDPVRFVRGLLWLRAHGTVVIGSGLAGTGLVMLGVLGSRMLEQPRLLVSLATYAVIVLVAFAFQRPALRRLQASEVITDDADRDAWRATARRQRYLAYGITSDVGLIAFLMSTRPVLW